MAEHSETITQILIELSNLTGQLGSVPGDSEESFIKLGNDLQSIYSEAEKIGTHSVDAAELVSGGNGTGVLSDIGMLSRLSLEKLDTCAKNAMTALQDLEACSGYLKSLEDKNPTIIRVAKTLNMVALNISVESSRNHSSDEKFKIFVNEIKLLARRVNDLARKIKDGSEEARTNQKKEFDLILNRRDQLGIITEDVKIRVSGNMSQIDALLGMSLNILSNSESHSRKISALVGDVVASIQFHDIARQQIEHIVHALRDLSNLNDASHSSENHAGKDHDYEKTYSIINIQISQLSQVIEEINDAHEKIMNAFENIGSEIDALVKGLDDMEKHEGLKNSGQEGFNSLISELGKLNDIAMQGKDLVGDIFDKIHESSSSASNISSLLSQMEDLGMDLHIKAINALIMSKKLGSNGETISILAKDVRDISKGSNDFVSDIVKILKSIDGLGHELDCFGSSNGDAQEKDNLQSLTEGIRNISNIHDEFLKILIDCLERAAFLKKELIRIKSDLEFIRKMSSALEENLHLIKRISERVAALSGKKELRVLEADKEVKRYTMHIEREIYHKMTGKSSIQKSGVSGGGIGDGRSDLGNNVQLF
jgi:methyl-accepting chemotaxis protein